MTLSLWLIEDERMGREREEGRDFYLFTFVLYELDCGPRTGPISCSDSPWNPFPTLHPSLQVTYRFPQKEETELTQPSVVVTVLGERRALDRLNLSVGLNKNWHLLNEVFGWSLLDNNFLAFLSTCAIDTLHPHFWLQLLASSKDADIVNWSWLQGVERGGTKLMKGDLFLSLLFFFVSYPKTDCQNPDPGWEHESLPWSTLGTLFNWLEAIL